MILPRRDPKLITRQDIKLVGGTTRIQMREILKGHGLEFAEPYPPMPPFLSFPEEGSMFICHCCPIKSKDPAIPRDFYLSKAQQQFMTQCERHGIPYAIISDLYGITFADELLLPYDLPPYGLSNEELQERGRMIREKCDARGITTLHYIYRSPVSTVPYQVMLQASGIPYTYSSRFSLPDGTCVPPIGVQYQNSKKKLRRDPFNLLAKDSTNG